MANGRIKLWESEIHLAMDCCSVQDLKMWKAFGTVFILEVERIQKGLRVKKVGKT